jgi:predicted  nucleic acid-binding Zn-ribbon protein
MKRFLIFGSTLVVCGLLIGCGSESRDELVKTTINVMEESATQVGTIRGKVDEAIKKTQRENTPLDLAEAVKAAEELKNLGTQAQQLKRRTEAARDVITDAEREANAKGYRGRIEEVINRLEEERVGLRKSLQTAEGLNKKKTDELRKKITEAEVPFEALARQS